ncbi:hypothetical protein L2E82_32753 [Cichorium intybus]|uniref:Uncharacterized protein n=1 Tax=Cichorium intybus TaxID=13427 RepID=A0ACB9BJ38_CICIN|nr:hypothetical protein L2E82_32753 [Cichorium intybus]
MQFEISRQELKISRTRNWVPEVGGLRKLILEESHKSKYSIHSGSTKTYQDLKRQYWWLRMKKRIAKYISKCAICAQVKAEHQVPHGDAQSLHIPAGKWEDVTMDFIVGLPRTRRGYEMSPWKGVVRFGKRGKLSSKYIEPFRILKRVELQTFKLKLLHEEVLWKRGVSDIVYRLEGGDS